MAKGWLRDLNISTCWRSLSSKSHLGQRATELERNYRQCHTGSSSWAPRVSRQTLACNCSHDNQLPNWHISWGKYNVNVRIVSLMLGMHANWCEREEKRQKSVRHSTVGEEREKLFLPQIRLFMLTLRTEKLFFTSESAVSGCIWSCLATNFSHFFGMICEWCEHT